MSREDNRQHQREMEAFRAGAKFASLDKSAWFKNPIVVAVVAALIGAGFLLYTQGPYVEIASVEITCAICDNPEQIHPPTSSHDNGATIGLKIRNSGSMGTTIVNHNITLYLQPGPLSEDFDFQERVVNNDNISFGLGSHSEAALSYPTNEVIIYSMRHGSPIGSTGGPMEFLPVYLFGHVNYRSAFHFQTRLRFCFQYWPPYKGLPEKWGVCQR
jgi:hypothetical protein